jgi:hypothetical protein
MMPEQARARGWDKDERSFDMRALWRSAVWGAAATAGLAAVVLAANSNVGSQRLMTAVTPASSQPSAAELAARSAETASETRRLSEAVQALDADRARLLTRITSLERNLEDITGSIKRQATSAPAPAGPPAPESAPPSAAVSAPVAAADRVAAVSAGGDEAEAKHAKPEIALDVGGAVNFDGLRLLWNSTKGTHVGLFEDLKPLVAVRENRKTRATELRLLVGPFADSETATAVCAALAGLRRFCQLTAFEGQQFSLAEPEGRPIAAPARRLPAPPKPARPNP